MLPGFTRTLLAGWLLATAATWPATALAEKSGAGAVERERTRENATDEARAFAAALLAETNRVRLQHGRRTLRARAELEAAADDQAAFMALRMTAQHGSFLPGQGTAKERVRRHGLEPLAVTENVASTPLGTEGESGTFSAAEVAARLVEQWMDSPGHRANLLDRRLTHFGGAVRIARLGKQWTAYGVQVFMIARPPHGHVVGSAR